MSKVWGCALLALLLSGCGSRMSLPFELPFPSSMSSSVSDRVLLEWLQISTDIMGSNEARRLSEIRRLQQAAHRNDLTLALWLSHPRANLAQRQQAQQLFARAMPGLDPRLQRFFAVYQAYNQELITFNRVVTDRQQQINALTDKLRELATIDEQINERRYQGTAP